MGKRKEKGKTGKNLCRWVAVAGICLLFYGCGAASGTPEQTEGPRDPEGLQAQEGAKPGEEEPASSQVLEVGIMADGTNPYAVVASETFCRKAGESSYPIVVEYHDSRDGCDTQKAQLRGLKERGVDILLIHVVDLERYNETVDAVWALEGVANYSAEGELAEGFVAVRNAVTALAYVLVAILAAVSLFIIANTIRLATFARRDEIAIMKMCGATDGFVRGPFVVEGLILGLMGALVAFLLQWAVYGAVCRAIISSGALALFDLVAFSAIWPRVLGIFLVAGAAIGAVGSGVAIRKFLQV